jgi:uncharacterized Zn finger protein
MATIPKLTPKAIQRQVGERIFNLGQRYFEDGALFDLRRQGNTLKGRCQGSRDEAYRVEATLKGKGVASAECSCPVGDGGHCKHVGALLVAWEGRPEEFTEVEELEPALHRRSKEELIALIKLMLRKEPDLELVLQTPLPGTGSARSKATPEAYRKQAATAFRHGGYEWGAAGAIADELQGIVEIGDEFNKQHDYAGAAAVYQGVLTAVMDNYHSVQDEEGDLHSVVSDCAQGLGKCLAEAKGDPARRQPILRVLFDLTLFDIEEGGIALSDDVPDLAEEATADERRLLAGWVRDALPKGADWSADWRRKALGGWLLQLEADTMDDEAFLRACRETGRRHDLVKRLLELGRLEEALEEIKAASDYDLPTLADTLVKHGHGTEADRIMAERAKKSKDVRILEWQKKRATARKDWGAVLVLAERLFRNQPSLGGYKDLRKLAQKQGRWDALRPQLLALLKKDQYAYVLIPIYLEEGEIDEALEAVKSGRPYSYAYGYGENLAVKVARAAEEDRPRAALDIYRKQAEGLIAGRNRSSYKEACQFLKKVRDLYKQMGEEGAWSKYVAKLRAEHKSLRALQEELTRAKL